MEPYPLLLKPVFKHRIWGGRKLQEVFGKDLGSDEKIGESWEVADLPNGRCTVANGELAGKTLGQAVDEYPEQITGDENFATPFPLLVKFLDAQDILSVQVHPDPETCRRMGRGDPKTECWYIVSAEPGAYIYKGLKRGVTRDKFARAIAAGATEELLEKVPVETGQCHFLPAGTAHSIGAGLLIAEVQTPSDTTYRVFDWNRVDADGNTRQLHIEEALESIHFDQAPDRLPVTSVGRLVDCEYFRLDKGHQKQACEMLLPIGQMRVLIFLTGFGSIAGETGRSAGFRGGDCVLIPATFEGTIKFAEETEYLTVTL